MMTFTVYSSLPVVKHEPNWHWLLTFVSYKCTIKNFSCNSRNFLWQIGFSPLWKDFDENNWKGCHCEAWVWTYTLYKSKIEATYFWELIRRKTFYFHSVEFTCCGRYLNNDKPNHGTFIIRMWFHIYAYMYVYI